MSEKLTKEEQAVLDRYELEIRQPDWHVVVADRDILVKAVRRLAPKPEPERLWLNVWRAPDVGSFSTSYSFKSAAEKCRANPEDCTYLGRWVLAVDGSSATWEGPDA